MPNSVRYQKINHWKFIRIPFLPTLFAIILGLYGSASAVPSGHGCTKGIVLSSITFTLTTESAFGNKVEIKDPASVIIGYVTSMAKKDLAAAAAKKSSFLTTMLAAVKTGKGYAEYVNLMAEFVSTAGLIVDKISMEIKYNCCDGASETAKTGKGKEEDLFLDLHEPSTIVASLAALPPLYISVMVDAANHMVADCPGTAH